MAVVKSLVSINELKCNLLMDLAKGEKQKDFMYYDEDLDELILLAADPRIETVVHYIENEPNVAIIYQADTLEIVGLQIEDFEKVFLPKYSKVEKAWRLSDCVQVENLWDMTVIVDQRKPRVAKEIARASIPILGEPARRLEKVFA